MSVTRRNETSLMSNIKIRTIFNPRSVADKSPNIDLDGEEESINIKEAKELDAQLLPINQNFFNKFGKRQGKVRTIIHWNNKVWNNKIVPNLRYEIEVDGEKKTGSKSEINDFLKKKLRRVTKIEIGIRGVIRTLYFGWGTNKHGKEYFGFVKKPSDAE